MTDATYALLITSEGHDHWSVWMSLPDHDPLEDAFGFVIGAGATRDEAVRDAVEALEACLDKLQQPAGAIAQRSIT